MSSQLTARVCTFDHTRKVGRFVVSSLRPVMQPLRTPNHLQTSDLSPRMWSQLTARVRTFDQTRKVGRFVISSLRPVMQPFRTPKYLQTSDLSPRMWSQLAAPNGESTASKFSAEEKVDTTAACDIIYNTMKALNFVPLPNYDDSLLADSYAYWDSLRDLDEGTKTTMLKIHKGSVSYGDIVYPFLPKCNRLALGIYTTYLVWLDDGAPLEDIKVFRKYCLSDRSKLSTALRHFADYVDTFTSYYGPHAGDSIWSATLQFLNSIIADEVHLKGIAVPRSAILFPDFQRFKSAVSEAYGWTAFCQADLPEDDWLARELFLIPDLIEFFTCGNDVVSFYKEHVIGADKFTYIWNYSNCHDIPLLDGLKNTASRLLSCVERMRTTSAGQPELLSKIEAVVLGYMQWHYYFNDRYHVQDMYELHNYCSTI